MRTPPNGAPPSPRPPAAWLLWASLLATPVLWFGWFMAAYAFNEATCSTARRAASELGVAVATVLFVATLTVALASLALTIATRRVRRRAVRTSHVYDDFLPRVGYVTGLLFTFVLFAHLVPIVLVGACSLGSGTG